jgi:hypothetical protein
MEKVFRLLLLILIFSQDSFAQAGYIISVNLFPANLNGANNVYIVAEVNVGHENCYLGPNYFAFEGDTIVLRADYCADAALSNCFRTDTFNLGILPAGSYYLRFLLMGGIINCSSPSALMDVSNGTMFSVAPFNGLVSNEKDNFSCFPNPTNNNEINIKAKFGNPYQLTCYNASGNLVFEMDHLFNQQKITLPHEQGMYFIKIVDAQHQIHLFKFLSL